MVDSDSREYHLVFHVQAKWSKKWSKNIFGDITGALPVFHDIIIGGKNEQGHDLILRKVLTRAQEGNIKFNHDKIQFRVSQVKYMGEVGFSPDPEKISVIHDMPTQACKTYKGYWA